MYLLFIDCLDTIRIHHLIFSNLPSHTQNSIIAHYIFESAEELKDFFNAAGSQIKQIPDELKQDFLNDFVDEFIKKANCDEEYIPVGFWCLQVIAKKPTLTLSIEREVEISDFSPSPTL